MFPSIQLLHPQDFSDFQSLLKIFESEFEMENFHFPQSEHLQNLLQNSNFLVVVAKDQTEVIGGLTAYILNQYYSSKPLVYIYDLAISKAYQRQGIGKNIIAFLLDHCKTNGYESIFVQADLSDQHALEFYRSTNISREDQVVHFTYNM